MKKINYILGIVLILIFTSCGSDNDCSETELKVVFSSLTADGASGAMTTTKLTLTFDKDVAGFSVDDITITESTVTKGALTGKGSGVYELEVSGITAEATITVAVSKADHVFTPASHTVTIYLGPRVIREMYAGRLGGELVQTSGVWQFEKDLYVHAENISDAAVFYTDNDDWVLRGGDSHSNGKRNTYIFNTAATTPGSSFTAANLCYQYNNNWEGIDGVNNADYKWFLPATNQLMSLWGVQGGFASGDEFDANPYWTSTESNNYGAYIAAWFVNFVNGQTNRNFWYEQRRVRCVRETVPEVDGPKVYKDGDKVVIDFSGLPAGAVTNVSKNVDAEAIKTAANNVSVFRKLEVAPHNLSSSGTLSPEGDMMAWADGYNGCDALIYNGDGWRMPTQRELMLMWVFKPALEGVFAGMGSDASAFSTNRQYWSASKDTFSTSEKCHYVYFDAGYVGATPLTSTYYVRCVREIRE